MLTCQELASGEWLPSQSRPYRLCFSIYTPVVDKPQVKKHITFAFWFTQLLTKASHSKYLASKETYFYTYKLVSQSKWNVWMMFWIELPQMSFTAHKNICLGFLAQYNRKFAYSISKLFSSQFINFIILIFQLADWNQIMRWNTGKWTKTKRCNRETRMPNLICIVFYFSSLRVRCTWGN